MSKQKQKTRQRRRTKTRDPIGVKQSPRKAPVPVKRSAVLRISQGEVKLLRPKTDRISRHSRIGAEISKPLDAIEGRWAAWLQNSSSNVKEELGSNKHVYVFAAHSARKVIPNSFGGSLEKRLRRWLATGVSEFFVPFKKKHIWFSHSNVKTRILFEGDPMFGSRRDWHGISPSLISGLRSGHKVNKAIRQLSPRDFEELVIRLQRVCGRNEKKDAQTWLTEYRAELVSFLASLPNSCQSWQTDIMQEALDKKKSNLDQGQDTDEQEFGEFDFFSETIESSDVELLRKFTSLSAAQLVKALQDIGVSNAELARRLGMNSHSQISKIQRGLKTGTETGEGILRKIQLEAIREKNKRIISK